jgi:hypothetical protein
MSSTWIVEAVDVSAKGHFGGGAGRSATGFCQPNRFFIEI